MTSEELAELIEKAALDKKARDVVAVDLRGKTTLADFFVICEGDTDRQVKAIVESVRMACREHGIRPLSSAGADDGSWACVDMDAVIVHVFLPGERTFYDLEALWNAMPPADSVIEVGADA